MTLRYVTIQNYAAASGYSSKAIERKIGSGVWIEGRQFRKAPDGRIMIDTIGAQAWVENQLAPSSPSPTA